MWALARGLFLRSLHSHQNGRHTRDDPWEKVDRGCILLAGSVKPELIRLLEHHGRDQINNATATDDYPSGLFGGSTFDRLRHHLGLTETNVIYPVTDAE